MWNLPYEFHSKSEFVYVCYDGPTRAQLHIRLVLVTFRLLDCSLPPHRQLFSSIASSNWGTQLPPSGVEVIFSQMTKFLQCIFIRKIRLYLNRVLWKKAAVSALPIEGEDDVRIEAELNSDDEQDSEAPFEEIDYAPPLGIKGMDILLLIAN